MISLELLLAYVITYLVVGICLTYVLYRTDNLIHKRYGTKCVVNQSGHLTDILWDQPQPKTRGHLLVDSLFWVFMWPFGILLFLGEKAMDLLICVIDKIVVWGSVPLK